MPLKNKRRAPAEEYDSDGGFIANDSGDDDKHQPPKSKKPKTSKAGAATTTASGSKSKASVQNGKSLPGGGQVGKEGEEYWEISGKRRVTLSVFGGKQMVNVREYYVSKDGDTLPGKKGISLTIEQFSNLISVLPHVESMLKSKGISIPRPDYGESAVVGEEEEEEEEEAMDEDKEGVKKNVKKNFEETSDEDS